MTYPIIIIAAEVVVILYCLFTDTEYHREITNGDNPLTMVGRLIARHVKMLVKLSLCFIFIFAGVGAILSMNSKKGTPDPNGGGPQTEQLSKFVNQITFPAQVVWDGFIFILGILAILFLVLCDAFRASAVANPRAWGLAVLGGYLFWLVMTIIGIVKNELSEKPATAETVAVWSGALFILWFPVLFVSLYGFAWSIHSLMHG